ELRPMAAARKVATGAQSHAWIPAPIQPGVPLPLSAAELAELYASTEALSREDEAELARPLPQLKSLLSPEKFDKVAEEHAHLSRASRSYRKELWKTARDGSATATLDKVLAKAVKAGEVLDGDRRWKLAAIAAGNEG